MSTMMSNYQTGLMKTKHLPDEVRCPLLEFVFCFFYVFVSIVWIYAGLCQGIRGFCCPTGCWSNITLPWSLTEGVLNFKTHPCGPMCLSTMQVGCDCLRMCSFFDVGCQSNSEQACILVGARKHATNSSVRILSGL